MEEHHKLSTPVCHQLMAEGKLYTKKTPTKMVKMQFPFSVTTTEGEMTGEEGDYLALDADAVLSF